MKSTTSACNNQFLELDGFCTLCGQNHFKNRRKQQRPATKSKQRPVVQPVTTAPKYQASELTPQEDK
jgi:hypothetical protein